VFVYYEGDHYRTRLTHTLEVAQLGRSIARGLGANEDLTEAICLAHDLGHPPFGHAGEHSLDELMKDYGGFNHNTQSYRIVTELEKRLPQFKGINLTYETREGMIKHETEYDKSDASEYEPDKRASLEAQIANAADEIAYNAHDLEDGLRAELFSIQDLADLKIWQALMSYLGDDSEPFSKTSRAKVIRELIGMMVTDVIGTTASNLERLAIDSPLFLQRQETNVVSYSEELGSWIRSLKDFLYQCMYRHFRLVRMQVKAERYLCEIFAAYLNEPMMLPTHVHSRLAETAVERVITDYIAGMTDRYAVQEWDKLFDPHTKA
ncbi:MAG TPA: HD domain-containing protein, partial [candidate division Zixibacteria bacterium]|nr:HD domain-containing protein [candidate division Zixibacteria bacterium]